MNLLQFILLLTILTGGCCNYAASLILTPSTFQRVITKPVPHLPDNQLMAVIRDFDATGKFPWNMTYQHDPKANTVTFNFTYEWPSALNSMTIDYLLLSRHPAIRVFRQCILSFQTHLELNYLRTDRTYYLLLFPVGFSNFELTSGFTYMTIPEPSYKMFAIHYMHMHNGNHDEAMSKMDFDDKGEWVTFQYVVIENEGLDGCKVLDKNHVRHYQNFPVEKCKYFGGIKSTYKYNSKAQFYFNDSIVAFKDYKKTDFGIAALPLPYEGFIDKRVFGLKPEVDLGEEGEKQQDYWFVVYILGAGVLISLLIILYGYIMLRRADKQKGQRMHLVNRKSRQTMVQSEAHSEVSCSTCGKSVELPSEVALNDQPHYCKDCKIEPFSD